MFPKIISLLVFFTSLYAVNIENVLAQDDSSAVIIEPKAIYGEDDRIEVAAADELHRRAAKSVAALFDKKTLSKGFGGTNSWALSDKPTLQDKGWCENETFSHQPATANCTGFLVGADRLVTSAHCVYEGKQDHYKHGQPCSDIAIVFDFVISDEDSVSSGVQALSSEQLYFCKNVINSRYERTGSDWAILQLDRSVSGRAPLHIYAAEQFEETASISVIGHPLGLPAKVSTNARVLEQSRSDYVITNLDTYDGNSGSPVFVTVEANDSSGHQLLVIGLLSRGEKDDELVSVDANTTCKVSRRCDNLNCSGEHVTRITELPEFKAVSH